MPIGEVVANVLMCAAWLVAGRRRTTFWLWPWTAVMILLAMLFVLWRDGLWPMVVAGPISGTATVAAPLIAVVSWAYVFGLPRPIALRLGIGLTSRQLAFDNRMIDTIRPFYDAFVRAQQDRDRRESELHACERQLKRLSSLDAPDAVWAGVRDDLVAEYRRWIELVRVEPLPEEPAYDINAAPALVRWRSIEAEAAQAQKALATPSRRRRGEAVWFLTAAVAALLIGLGRLPSIIHGGTLWLDVVLVVVAFAIAAGAFLEAGQRISGRHGPGWG